MKYPYSVSLVLDGDDKYWLAKSTCLNGCIGQGDSVDEAVQELGENEIAWLETAAEVGIEIPEVPVEVENSYSGKVALRMSPAIHKKAVKAAKREGISLNQFINDAIVTYAAEIETTNYVSKAVSKAVSKSFMIIETALRDGMTSSAPSSQLSIIPGGISQPRFVTKYSH